MFSINIAFKEIIISGSFLHLILVAGVYIRESESHVFHIFRLITCISLLFMTDSTLGLNLFMETDLGFPILLLHEFIIFN
jgi:hypothetical protein